MVHTLSLPCCMYSSSWVEASRGVYPGSDTWYRPGQNAGSLDKRVWELICAWHDWTTGAWTMEINWGSSASYLTHTNCCHFSCKWARWLFAQKPFKAPNRPKPPFWVTLEVFKSHFAKVGKVTLKSLSGHLQNQALGSTELPKTRDASCVSSKCGNVRFMWDVWMQRTNLPIQKFWHLKLPFMDRT